MQIRLLSKAVQAFRAGSVGDAAAYKAAALTAPAYPEVDRQLQGLDQLLPSIDLPALRQLDRGSFGFAYARFMQINKLKPLVLSPSTIVELSRENSLAVRYPLFHDAFHVLLGFDANLPGELGVWSFVAEQRYSPSFEHAALFARLLYPLAAPTRFGELRRARAAGQAIARQVPCLIAQPIETFWQLPLAAVRARLCIHAPRGT